MNVSRPVASVAVVPGPTPPSSIETMHDDRTTPATDGGTVAFRTTAAKSADPTGVLVFVTGTDMANETLDLPGNELAERGIATYADECAQDHHQQLGVQRVSRSSSARTIEP